MRYFLFVTIIIIVVFVGWSILMAENDAILNYCSELIDNGTIINMSECKIMALNEGVVN